MYHAFHKNMQKHNCFDNSIYNNITFFLSTEENTGVMAAENSTFLWQE